MRPLTLDASTLGHRRHRDAAQAGCPPMNQRLEFLNLKPLAVRDCLSLPGRLCKLLSALRGACCPLRQAGLSSSPSSHAPRTAPGCLRGLVSASDCGGGRCKPACLQAPACRTVGPHEQIIKNKHLDEAVGLRRSAAATSGWDKRRPQQQGSPHSSAPPGARAMASI